MPLPHACRGAGFSLPYTQPYQLTSVLDLAHTGNDGNQILPPKIVLLESRVERTVVFSRSASVSPTSFLLVRRVFSNQVCNFATSSSSERNNPDAVDKRRAREAINSRLPRRLRFDRPTVVSAT